MQLNIVQLLYITKYSYAIKNIHMLIKINSYKRETTISKLNEKLKTYVLNSFVTPEGFYKKKLKQT